MLVYSLVCCMIHRLSLLSIPHLLSFEFVPRLSSKRLVVSPFVVISLQVENLVAFSEGKGSSVPSFPWDLFLCCTIITIMNYYEHTDTWKQEKKMKKNVGYVASSRCFSELFYLFILMWLLVTGV